MANLKWSISIGFKIEAFGLMSLFKMDRKVKLKNKHRSVDTDAFDGSYQVPSINIFENFYFKVCIPCSCNF